MFWVSSAAWGLPVQGHTWEQKNWGYEKMSDSTGLLRRYEQFYAIVRELVAEKGLSASVYTQTTDVETETNGLMTYDRKVDKMGFSRTCGRQWNPGPISTVACSGIVRILDRLGYYCND